jgi:hypothetical protein
LVLLRLRVVVVVLKARQAWTLLVVLEVPVVVALVTVWAALVQLRKVLPVVLATVVLRAVAVVVPGAPALVRHVGLVLPRQLPGARLLGLLAV